MTIEDKPTRAQVLPLIRGQAPFTLKFSEDLASLNHHSPMLARALRAGSKVGRPRGPCGSQRRPRPFPQRREKVTAVHIGAWIGWVQRDGLFTVSHCPIVALQLVIRDASVVVINALACVLRDGPVKVGRSSSVVPQHVVGPTPAVVCTSQTGIQGDHPCAISQCRLTMVDLLPRLSQIDSRISPPGVGLNPLRLKRDGLVEKLPPHWVQNITITSCDATLYLRKASCHFGMFEAPSVIDLGILDASETVDSFSSRSLRGRSVGPKVSSL